jgi:hypothetical protein
MEVIHPGADPGNEKAADGNEGREYSHGPIRS